MVSETPLVSVIVPTYNRPELLERTLGSIEEQDYPHIEAIVVNDGGKDVGANVAKFTKARYFSHDVNRGLPAARNTGIRNANGFYIAYLDDDDIFYPNHVRVLVGAMRDGARAAYTDAEVRYNPVQAPRLYMSNDFDPVALRQGNLFPVCCVMHELSLIGEVGLFDETLPTHEDWDLWIRMSGVTDFVHIPEATCMVDHRSNRMTNDGHNMRRGWQMVKDRYN
jgi:glycosyltransferase involved in cell wall biosynthesis